METLIIMNITTDEFPAVELTKKRLDSLLSMKDLKKEHKLFVGEYNTVHASKHESGYKIRYGFDDKPGYMIVYIGADKLNSICQTWLMHPIINKSGLATVIWEDSTPNKLRRRLEQKVKYDTLTADEQKKIVSEVEKLLHLIKKSFESRK
jgi:hypothetical protein